MSAHKDVMVALGLNIIRECLREERAAADERFRSAFTAARGFLEMGADGRPRWLGVLLSDTCRIYAEQDDKRAPLFRPVLKAVFKFYNKWRDDPKPGQTPYYLKD